MPIVMRKRFTKVTTLNFIVVINNETQSSQGNGFIGIFALLLLFFTRIGIAMTCDY